MLSVTLPDDALSTLQEVDPATFPNISVALRILCVLPVTDFRDDASRDGMGRLCEFFQERGVMCFKPEPLALLYVHRDKEFDIDDIIDKYEANLKKLSEPSAANEASFDVLDLR